MKYKLGLIFVCLLLVLSFVSAEGLIQDCMDGGALFNDSQVCWDETHHRIYSPLLPSSYYTLRVLMVMIAEENRLRKELNEMKDELSETRKELNELREMVEAKDDSSTNSGGQVLTGAMINDNDSPEIEDEEKDWGIFEFLKRIFGKK
jgi:hypothetical protein